MSYTLTQGSHFEIVEAYQEVLLERSILKRGVQGEITAFDARNKRVQIGYGAFNASKIMASMASFAQKGSYHPTMRVMFDIARDGFNKYAVNVRKR